jgi:hypothetical protein
MLRREIQWQEPVGLLPYIGNLFRAGFTATNDFCIANLIVRNDRKFVSLDALLVEFSCNFRLEFFAKLCSVGLPNTSEEGEQQSGVFHGVDLKKLMDDDGLMTMARTTANKN